MTFRSVRIIPWAGIALIAVCIGAQAQGIHKCVGKDGKTAYSNDPCPGSKEVVKQPAAQPAAASGPVVPDMQPGKWKLRFTREGRSNDEEACGDPIDGMRREVQEYQAKAKANWGCTMTVNPAGGRNVNIVYDCPSDRSPDGRPVRKGRTELSVVSASPQAFRIDMKSTAYGGYVMEGTRIGECAK
jgi:hypothetical protein